MKALMMLICLVLVGKTRKESPMSKEIKKMKFPELKWEVPTVGKEIKKISLDSGTSIYLKENHTLPLVEISVFVKGGLTYLKDGDKLLPDLLASTLVKGGTKSFKPDEIIDSLEYKGIRVNVDSKDEYFTVNLTYQPRYEDFALKILEEILFYPTFNADVVEKEKAKIVDFWHRNMEDPDTYLNEVSMTIIYKGNSLGSKPNWERFNSVKPVELSRIHRLFFQPKNMAISAVGDFNREELGKKLSAIFTSDKNDSTTLTYTVPEEIEGGKVYFFQKEADQGYFYFVQDFPKGYFDDVFATFVAIDVLGGGFNSKIVSKVRNELGLAYETYAYFSPVSNLKGVFYAYSATRADAVDQSIYYIKDAIQQLISGKITNEEFNFAKESFINSSVTSFGNDWGFMQRIALRSLFGFPDDYYVKMMESLKKLTLDDVKMVSRKYLDLSRMSIIIVGDSTKIDLGKLRQFGDLIISEY